MSAEFDHVFPEKHPAQIQSIAVLPLTNLSGDASQEYFADGMTDELITAIAKNRSWRVVSRTTVMQYKGVRRPLRDVARELGASLGWHHLVGTEDSGNG
jgi:TolB-like protein